MGTKLSGRATKSLYGPCKLHYFSCQFGLRQDIPTSIVFFEAEKRVKMYRTRDVFQKEEKIQKRWDKFHILDFDPFPSVTNKY